MQQQHLKFICLTHIYRKYNYYITNIFVAFIKYFKISTEFHHIRIQLGRLCRRRQTTHSYNRFLIKNFDWKIRFVISCESFFIHIYTYIFVSACAFISILCITLYVWGALRCKCSIQCSTPFTFICVKNLFRAPPEFHDFNVRQWLLLRQYPLVMLHYVYGAAWLRWCEWILLLLSRIYVHYIFVGSTIFEINKIVNNIYVMYVQIPLIKYGKYFIESLLNIILKCTIYTRTLL